MDSNGVRHSLLFIGHTPSDIKGQIGGNEVREDAAEVLDLDVSWR